MLKYQFDWSVITSGQYLQWLIDGLWLTLKLSFSACLFALLLGAVIAVLRLSPLSLLRGFAASYVEFFRNTPLLIQIFFWYFGAYEILPQSVNDWLNQTNFEFAAALIALSIYTSAFIAEDIRSGVRAISKGQMEAALSQGFGYLAAMRYVILPQATRIMVPPLINQFLNATKNSSLAMTIGVAELTYQARQIESYSFKGFEAFSAATLVYVAISLIITAVVTLYSKKILETRGMA